MPERGEYDLLGEWQSAMRSLAGGSVELPQRLLSALQRQTELVEEVLERERRRQQDLLAEAFAPLDGVFDMLEQASAALQQQAEALRTSAQALEQAAAMVESQAELFERAVVTLRRPSEIVKRAGGLDHEREDP